MGQEVFILLIFLLAGLLIYNLIKFWQDRTDFFKSLGAHQISVHQVINPKGVLEYQGLQVEVFTGDYKGKRLTVRIKTNLTSFLTLRKRNFFDKITGQLSYLDLAVEYEDKVWFDRLTNHKLFRDLLQRLLDEASIDRLELRKNSASISWNIKRTPFEVGTEKVFKALSLLKDMVHILSTLPNSRINCEERRQLLLYKIPIVLTVSACLVGVAGKFYHYMPLCPLEIIFFGYSSMTPFVLLYIGFILFFAGGYGLRQRILGTGLIVWLLCVLFISLFFLSYINGKLDTSPPQIKKDRVEHKYYSPKRGHKIVLSNLHRERKLCDSLSVSEEFYQRVQIGDYVQYSTKRGFLGVEWLYRKLRITSGP